MSYWLLKSDPDDYGWSDLVREKRTRWDGVRNFQARNALAKMKAGDVAFIYHSMEERQIMGLARIVSGPYGDPKAKGWVVVDVEAWKPLEIPVTLHAIKLRKTLAKIPLVTQPRLSVMPLTLGQAKAVLAMGKTELEK